MTDDKHPVAFFSAEYAIEEILPMYAGGLGVLSADYLMEAGEEGVPFIGIGLYYHYGFNVDGLDESLCTRLPIEEAGFKLVERGGEPIKLQIPIFGVMFTFQAWSKQYGSATLYLIDADVEENDALQRRSTAFLYDSNFQVKIIQEALLGIGGVILLEELNIEPDIYHINEGHAGFATLGLMGQCQRLSTQALDLAHICTLVKEKVVSTKHTILPASGLHIHRNTFLEAFADYFSQYGLNSEDVFKLGAHSLLPDTFSGTQLMLNLSRKVNAVSSLHAVFEKQVHPNSTLISITNAVHRKRWEAPDIRAARSDEEFWHAHQLLRKQLLTYVKDMTNVELQEDALTIVWARRLAAYKRPDLIFTDLERLIRICSNKDKPVQIIIAGKANTADPAGQAILRAIRGYTEDPRLHERLVYLHDYNIVNSLNLVHGADIWLNTPVRGQEASGTSGMKAGLNGVLQASVMDGWIDEIDLQKHGWILNNEDTATHLYDQLENSIVPMFYNRDSLGIPLEWLNRMNSTRQLIIDQYTTRRMLKDYIVKLYKKD